MEKSTVVGHKKCSEIAPSPTVLEWVRWWVVCSGGLYMVLMCGWWCCCGGGFSN